MAGAFSAVPEHKSLFSEEFAVKGASASKILNRLARNGQMISVFPDDTKGEYLSSVIDQLDSEGRHIVLDQPAKAPSNEPVFDTDQRILIIWSELGMHLGVVGTVTAVNTHDRILSYRVELDGAVYRQQRRESFRVPVGPDDGISAELIVGRDADNLTARVKDISETGCRFAVSLEKAREAGIAKHMQAGAHLVFEHEDATTFDPEIKVVWLEKADGDVMDLGVTWGNRPDEDFVALVRHFVVRKERLLLKRRTGLDL